VHHSLSPSARSRLPNHLALLHTLGISPGPIALTAPPLYPILSSSSQLILSVLRTHFPRSSSHNVVVIPFFCTPHLHQLHYLVRRHGGLAQVPGPLAHRFRFPEAPQSQITLC
jgi:hypothetical protein